MKINQKIKEIIDFYIKNEGSNYEKLAYNIENILTNNNILFFNISNKKILKCLVSNFYFIYYEKEKWMAVANIKNTNRCWHGKILWSSEIKEENKIINFIRNMN